jgi:hypothetical protein
MLSKAVLLSHSLKNCAEMDAEIFLSTSMLMVFHLIREKRKKTFDYDRLPTLRHHEYSIAWICALPMKLAAARAILDETNIPSKPCRVDGWRWQVEFRARVMCVWVMSSSAQE